MLVDSLIAIAVTFVGLVIVYSLFFSVGKVKKGQLPKAVKKPPPPKKNKKQQKKKEEDDEPLPASLVGPLQTGMTTDKQTIIKHDEGSGRKKGPGPTAAAAAKEKDSPVLTQKQRLDAIAKGFVPVEKKKEKKAVKDPNFIAKQEALDNKLNSFFKSGGKKGGRRGDANEPAAAEAPKKEGGVVSQKAKIHSADPKGYWGQNH